MATACQHGTCECSIDLLACTQLSATTSGCRSVAARDDLVTEFVQCAYTEGDWPRAWSETAYGRELWRCTIEPLTRFGRGDTRDGERDVHGDAVLLEGTVFAARLPEEVPLLEAAFPLLTPAAYPSVTIRPLAGPLCVHGACYLCSEAHDLTHRVTMVTAFAGARHPHNSGGHGVRRAQWDRPTTHFDTGATCLVQLRLLVDYATCLMCEVRDAVGAVEMAEVEAVDPTPVSEEAGGTEYAGRAAALTRALDVPLLVLQQRWREWRASAPLPIAKSARTKRKRAVDVAAYGGVTPSPRGDAEESELRRLRELVMAQQHTLAMLASSLATRSAPVERTGDDGSSCHD
jgi:hypothetical protein